MRKEYWIKRKPKDGKGKFSLYWRQGRKGGHPVVSDRLDAINKQLKDKVIDLEIATQMVESLKKQLQSDELPGERGNYAMSEVNKDVFERYWKHRYSRSKIDPDSKRSAKDAIKRAITALGELSLISSDILDLQEAIDELPANRQRRAASWINSLLKYCDRKDKLVRVDDKQIKVNHLNPGDVTLLASIVDKKYKLPILVAFHTGMRLGEIFGVTKYMEEDRCVYVERQMHAELTYGPTKTRKPRFAAVSPEGVEIVKEWLQVPESEKQVLRALDWSKIVRRASHDKYTFHDLRHSYAIFALSRGVSLDLVALSLGNSITVCQRYYVGFSITSELAQRIKAQWK